MIYLSLRKVDALEKDKLAQATKIKFEEEGGGMISDIDADAEISLVDETQRLDDDLIFDTTADLVTTVSSLVTTDSVTITAAKPVSAAAKELTDNDMTMAKALAELKTSKPKVVTIVPILYSTTTVTTTKPKAKGITIQEPSVTQKTIVLFLSSSEGKAIMIESEKPVKIKDLSAHDEQVAKDLHDKIQVQLEEEAKRQEESFMAALAEVYDVVQAQIDADQELSARMTLEEHEKYTVEERARMLAEFIKNRKKQLVVERDEAIRSKPPIKSQLRNLMMTYLKNTGRFTHAQLKHRDFKEIQGLYNISRLSLKWFQVDELWKNQEYWILKSWNLYENCRVHILMLEDGTEFHMLAERKYPLTKETLEKMLVLRLTAESESEAAFDLLRFIQKQIDEM
ncbi:hypothetical protein Tco_0465913 [Tanacetum coccineum]